MRRQFTYQVKIQSPFGTHVRVVRASSEARAGLAALEHMDQRNPRRLPIVVVSVNFK